MANDEKETCLTTSTVQLFVKSQGNGVFPLLSRDMPKSSKGAFPAVIVVHLSQNN